jgi:transcriptional regulator NrdR family protein
MTTVIKKGGRRQAFSAAKIKRSVLKAAKEAKLSKSKAQALVKEVATPVIALCKKKRTVKSSYIRKTLLGRLNRKAKSVVSAWRKYDRRKK